MDGTHAHCLEQHRATSGLIDMTYKFAIYSTAMNGLLWLDTAPSQLDAIRAFNVETPFTDNEPSDDDEFIFVVQVSDEEAKQLEQLGFGDRLPKLKHEIQYIDYKHALELVAPKA